MESAIPRGVRDFSPSEAIARKNIIAVVEEMFKRFGFYPIETSSLENIETLSAKSYGEEASKEIFTLDDNKMGLRFDFTVPLARYISMNKSVNLPFKRYQIGNIWRNDEPQKMRHREFLQADIDILGSKEVASDAEVLACASICLEKLGVQDYEILINSRPILEAILTLYKVPEGKKTSAIRIIDKLEKISTDETIKQLTALGMDTKLVQPMLEFIRSEESEEKKIDKAKANLQGAKEEIAKLEELVALLKSYNLSGKVTFDMSLARGLDYYTGFVWEIIIRENGKRLPSVTAGGRYDNLMKMYGGRDIAATGISLGIDRLAYLLYNEKTVAKTYTKVFVAAIKKENYGFALDVANKFRAKGIYTDLSIMDRNISKNLDYANAMKFDYVAIVGSKEIEQKKVRLRNLISGKEELLDIDEAIKELS